MVRHARLARPRLAGSAGRGSLGIRKFLGKRKSSQVHQVAIYRVHGSMTSTAEQLGLIGFCRPDLVS